MQAHPYHSYFSSIQVEGIDAHTVNANIVKVFLQKATDDYNEDKYYYNIHLS